MMTLADLVAAGVDIRILTLWEPWATLLAVGEKRIETRGHPIGFRGWVIIHAAAETTHPIEHGLRLGGDGTPGQWTAGTEYYVDAKRSFGDPYMILDLCNEQMWPLRPRHVLAIGHLAEVVPIEACSDTRTHICRGVAYNLNYHTPLDQPDADGETERDISTELPLGDYTEGRYGWVFDHMVPIPTPIPWVGGQGLRHAPTELLDQLADIALPEVA